MAAIKEGFVDFKGYKTYYRIVGEGIPGKLPLLALHGGPGCAHDYLESLDGIAEKYGRQVVYYDQLGCGKSVVPGSHPDMWCEELWQEEIDVVRKALGLTDIHLLGQSWGGMLSMRYAITAQPQGVHSMTIASSPADISLWVSEANRLIGFMPEKMQAALKQADIDGDYTRPEYIEAYNEYYRRHVCRIVPNPEFVTRSFAQMGEPYMVMQGASEFVVTGKMKTFNYVDRLKEITIPTLVTSGMDDEATPAISKQIFDRVPDCKWELIPGTHLCHVEYPEMYNEIVEKFMEAHE